MDDSPDTPVVRPFSFPFLPALVGWALFLGTAEALTLGLSLLQVSITQAIALRVLLLAAVIGLLTGRVLRGTKQPAPTRRAEASASWRSLLLALAAGGLFVYLLLWPLACLTPEQMWDGNAYHLPTIHLWAMPGYVHWVTPPVQGWGTSNFLDNGNILFNGFPKAVELMGFLTFRATGYPGGAATGNLWFLPLAILGIGYLTMALGASAEAALWAGSAFVLIPAVQLLTTTTYVDPGYAAALTGLVALTAWAGGRIRGAEGGPWLLPVVALGAAAGLTMGGKSTGLAAAALSGVLLLACAVVGKRRGRYEHVPPAHGGRTARLGGWLRLAVAALIAALLVGGYWPLRNWTHTGNPVYPAHVALGPVVLFAGWDPSFFLATDLHTPPPMRELPAGLRFVYTWPQGLDQWPREVGRPDSPLAGLGWIWLLGALPAIVYALGWRRQRPPQRERRLFLAIMLGIIVPMFLITPTNWWARLVVWIYALGLPCLGLALDRVGEGRRGGASGVLARGWALLCLAVLIGEGLIVLEISVGRMLPAGRVPHPRAWFHAETWRWNLAPAFPESAGTRLDDVLRSDKPIILGPLGRDPRHRAKVTLLGQLCRPLGNRLLLAVGLDPTASELEALQVQGAQWLIWDDDLPLPETVRQLATREDHIPGFWVVTLQGQTGR